MRYKILSLSVIIFMIIVPAFALTGDDVINKIDSNMIFGTARFEASMIIHIGDEVRTKKMLMLEKGRTDAFMEFTYPARDRGVKYLKIEDNMWIYMPSVEKSIKIAGHMLRQSMMGSDFSYEDALESSKLREKYTSTLVGEEKISSSYPQGGKIFKTQYDCHVVDLIAKVQNVTYYKRTIWVDKKTFVPVKEALYAKSGKMLKVQTMDNIKQYGVRNYPTYYTIKDLLRKDSVTEMFIEKAEFDIILPGKVFTQENLLKK